MTMLDRGLWTEDETMEHDWFLLGAEGIEDPMDFSTLDGCLTANRLH